MQTYTASIFVELEIKVSGTLTEGCRESYNPPSPAEPSGWEDIQIEGIAIPGFGHAPRRELLPKGRMHAGMFAAFLGNIEDALADQINEGLAAEVPDGPDPDDARDRLIDARLMGDD